MVAMKKEIKKLYKDALYIHLVRYGFTKEQAKSELKKHLNSLYPLYRPKYMLIPKTIPAIYINTDGGS